MLSNLETKINQAFAYSISSENEIRELANLLEVNLATGKYLSGLFNSLSRQFFLHSDNKSPLQIHIPSNNADIVNDLLFHTILHSIDDHITNSLFDSNQIETGELLEDPSLCVFDDNAFERGHLKPEDLFYRIKTEPSGTFDFCKPFCENDNLKLSNNDFIPLLRRMNDEEGLHIQMPGGRLKKSYIKERDKLKARLMKEFWGYSRLSKVIQEKANVLNLNGFYKYDQPASTYICSTKRHLDFIKQSSLYNPLFVHEQTDKKVNNDQEKQLTDPAVIIDATGKFSTLKHLIIQGGLKNIILFDIAGDHRSSAFNIMVLDEICRSSGLPSVNFVVFSFSSSKTFSISSINRAVNSVHFHQFSSNLNHGLKESNSIVLHPYECENIIRKSRAPKYEIFKIDGLGILWDSFYSTVTLSEHLPDQLKSFLTSIYFRNILVCCPDNSVKEIILDEIRNNSSATFSSRYSYVYSFQDLDEKLLDILERLLDRIIGVGVVNYYLSKMVFNHADVIIPSWYIETVSAFEALSQSISNQSSVKLIQWSALSEDRTGHLFIFDYRDTGRYPFLISPNIFQLYNVLAKQITAFISEQLFKYNYSYTYSEYNGYIFEQYLKSKERKKLFSSNQLDYFNEIINGLNDLKKSTKTDIFLDYNHQLRDEYDSVSLSIITDVTRKYSASDQFIVLDLDSQEMTCLRADQLNDADIDHIQIQCVKDIVQKIDIFEMDDATTEQIKRYRETLGYSDLKSNERLWKTLLKRMVDELGASEVFMRLDKACKSYNVEMVSLDWFLSNWANPESDSIAPNSIQRIKAIRDVCNLDDVYLRYLLKMKAAKKQDTYQTHSFLTELIESFVQADLLITDEYNYTNWFDMHHKSLDFENYGFSLDSLEDEIKIIISMLKSSFEFKTLKGVA